ncbi:MAG: PLP-dependent lyase/thiolase [Ilumatobacteraceae bacterium]
MMAAQKAVSWRCAVCGTRVAIDQALQWRCPNACAEDWHHVLHVQESISPLRGTGDPNPYLAFRSSLAWDAFAAAHGLSETERDALIRDIDNRIATVAGTGFRTTPYGRNDALSDALGFTAAGGVWIKDETHNVAGSHKARHLFTELLHLLVAERVGATSWRASADRPPLAIASCGNAAFAAATLARSVQWPLRVFVPMQADDALIALLESLDAHIVRCPRRENDPPGDPCVHRFREEVAQGAIPFGVQGPENAWCLDGGRTIGWEIADAEEKISGPPLDRFFVQIGGGAFAACAAAGLFAGGIRPRLHAVQAQGCAPLARAWNLAGATGGVRNAGSRWSQCMWPWEEVPSSLADGILDDETYDWIAVCNAMADSGGSPVVASEQHIMEAYALAHRATTIDVSATGTAGLAGVLAIRHEMADDERVAVVFSGVRRNSSALPE